MGASQNGFRDRVASRRQHLDLPELSDDLFKAVTPPAHPKSSSTLKSHTSGRITFQRARSGNGRRRKNSRRRERNDAMYRLSYRRKSGHSLLKPLLLRQNCQFLWLPEQDFTRGQLTPNPLIL
jgi:hypothetical protein